MSKRNTKINRVTPEPEDDLNPKFPATVSLRDLPAFIETVKAAIDAGFLKATDVRVDQDAPRYVKLNGLARSRMVSIDCAEEVEMYFNPQSQEHDDDIADAMEAEGDPTREDVKEELNIEPAEPAVTVEVVTEAPAATSAVPHEVTELTKQYKGVSYTLQVVRENGIESYRVGDDTFKTLSGAAKSIVGSSVNGLVFWGIKGTKKANPSDRAPGKNQDLIDAIVTLARREQGVDRAEAMALEASEGAKIGAWNNLSATLRSLAKAGLPVEVSKGHFKVSA